MSEKAVHCYFPKAFLNIIELSMREVDFAFVSDHDLSILELMQILSFRRFVKID